MRNSDVKVIGEQEFQKVKWGLAEKQVMAYIDRLIKERDGLLGKQQHLSSLHILAEKTVTDANELAQQILEEAQEQAKKLIEETEQRTSEALGEARSEADRTITEANELAEQAVTEANDLALQVTQQTETETTKLIEETEQKTSEALGEARSEADRTITEANKLSEKTIAETNKQAEKIVKEASFLAEKIREEAQDEANKVTEESQRRTAEILSEAQNETETKVTEANELVENIKQEAQDQAKKTIEEAEEKASEVIHDAQKRAETEVEERLATVMNQSKQEAASIIETARQNVSGEIEEFQNRFSARLQRLISEISAYRDIADQAEAGKTVADDDALALSVPETEVGDISNNGSQEMLDTTDDSDYQLTSLLSDEKETDEELIPVDLENKSAESIPMRYDAILFTGEIEIAMPPPVDMAQLIRFRRILQSIKGLKVSRTTGSWNEGSIITSLIDKPLPLLDLLKDMPEVEKTELLTPAESDDNTYPWGTTFEEKPDDWQGQRIVVTLQGETE